MPEKAHRDECKDRQKHADFTYFLHMTRFCPDEHWYPQRDAIDEKWWPYITFIGYLETVEFDAKRLLQSVKSSKDNLTAWEKFGKSGFGKNGNDPFMVSQSFEDHHTDARDKLTKYYGKCDEIFVEKYSAREWESPYFHFEKIKLYNRSSSIAEDRFQCGLPQ